MLEVIYLLLDSDLKLALDNYIINSIYGVIKV